MVTGGIVLHPLTYTLLPTALQRVFLDVNELNLQYTKLAQRPPM